MKPKPMRGLLNVYGQEVEVEWKSYDAFIRFQCASKNSREMMLARGYGVKFIDELPAPIEELKAEQKKKAAARRKKKVDATGKSRGRIGQTQLFSKAKGIPVERLKEVSAEA